MEGAHSLEPQKAHSTSDFTILMQYCGHMLLHLAYRLAILVRQTNFKFGQLKKKI